MKKTFKKLLSILMVFAMLFGMIPTQAFAADETIDTISATVTLPVKGANPVETGTPGDSSYKIIRVSFSEKDPETGIYTSLESTDTFKAGKTYMVNVLFRANSGYAIDRNTVSASINGQTAAWWGAISDGHGSQYFYIEYTVPEDVPAAKTPINFVKVSDITEPVIGATPDFDITLTGDGVVFDEEEYPDGVAWYKVNMSGEFVEWVPMDEDTEFGAGLYELQVALKPGAEYEFTDATKFYYNEYELPAWHDTYESNYDWWADEGVDILLYFTLEDPAAPTEITSLSATVTEPVAGASPSFEAVAGGEGYTAEVEWESEDAQLYPEDGYEFKAGEKYYLYVAFNAKEGCEFADNVTITINGDTPEDIFEHEGKIVALVTYTTPVPTPITSVKISDITEPVIGATPDFDITLTGDGVVFDEEEGKGWWKIEPETYHWELMDEDTPFSAGLYALEVCLKSKAGYEFTDATKFYYNEDELPEYDGSYESNYELWDGGAGIYLYFTLESATPVQPAVALNESAITLTVGETATLVPTITPADLPNYALSWKSDDESVATVDSDGKITAVAAGTATITVTLNPNNMARSTETTALPTATCVVTVVPQDVPQEPTTSVTVTKVWDAPEGTVLPESVRVAIYADGTQVSENVLSDRNNWTWTEELPVAMEDGTPIVYTVDELEVPAGYEKAVEKADATTGIGFTITNTLVEEDDKENEEEGGNSGATTPTTPSAPSTPSVPDTSDNTGTLMYLAAMAASAVALVLVLKKKRNIE